ncbi:hypothetical protein CU254_05505 [Amycolatopsis sp. AA4]|uniref:hypothetical protein n=1 Tax=Actinomycetes TaxID=1760 RepID=UPI0001B53F55|nr:MULTISPECIES: hypothetical protein [Actinomycetes]ATY09978.1 hypothetical protein CU254_05505 [Amycolatopsis sp. AA4]EFL05400.1 predicted protein [Streptomyces sp. AA4]
MTDSGQLLADLKTTTQAVENHDWVSAGLGGATTALDLLGASQDPLAALTSAGFGMITGLVRFLEEPLKQLQGNPDSVSSHSQGMESGGQQVSSVAEDYRQSAGPETSGWSGSSASSYRDNSSQHADCVEAVGQAGIAMAKAATGAGKVVAKAQQEVGGLISEAVGQIIQLMTQAFAAAQATFGASVAAAIPQAVAIATQYGGQIAQKLGVLLSDSENLLQLITSVTQGLEAATQLMTKLSAASKASSGESSSGAGADSSYSPYGSSAESRYPADSEYADDTDSRYPGQHRPRTPVSSAQQS